MADGIESYDEAKNIARVAAGFKGSTYFKNPNLAPPMTIAGEGYPAEVDAKLERTGNSDSHPPIQDPWMDRRAKSL